MQIGVIADDLTGAMDTGAQFASCGLDTVLQVSDNYPVTAQVGVINTGSREETEIQARHRTKKAVASLEGRLLYKKIDSTLRGHLAAEIQAVLENSRYRKAVICPMVIKENRQVINGQLWINELPLHQTAFARDPVWPAHSALIEDRLTEPAAHFSTQQIHAGASSLREQFLTSSETILVPDTASEDDLSRITRAIRGTDILPCGALSFAKAWATDLIEGAGSEQLRLPELTSPLLYVVGSRHPTTTAQLAQLRDVQQVTSYTVQAGTIDEIKEAARVLEQAISRNQSMLLQTSNTLLNDEHAKESMLEMLQTIVRHCAHTGYFGGYVVAGGETASRVLNTLCADAIVIQGEVITGLPYGIIEGGMAEGLSIFTKAGGFGPPGVFTHLLDYISSSTP